MKVNEKFITVKVTRFDPEKDIKARYVAYKVPYKKGMTVLDALIYIRENYDGSFAFRYGCRVGYCGSCSVLIDGTPGLACMEEVPPDKEHLRVEPLSNFPVIKDLVVDISSVDKRILSIRPYMERKEPFEGVWPLEEEIFERLEIVAKCISCVGCIEACPVFNEAPQEYAGPLPMLNIAKFAFDPRDEADRVTTAYFEGLYNCTGCGKCKQVCPYQIDIPELVIGKIKEKAISRNVKPPCLDKEINLITSTGKAFSVPKGKSLLEKIPSLTEVDDPATTVALFVGCFIDGVLRLQKSATSAIEVLKKNKIKVVVPKEQLCCGRPLLEIGERRKMDELVRKNVEVFEKTGVKEVVSLCSGCSLTLKKEYPSIFKRLEGREPEFKVYDICEFLAERVGLNPEKMNPLNLKVTYHDPCLLNRYQGISKEPRDILTSIPGVELVEMEQPDRCCGGGGVIRLTNSKLAASIGRRKVKDVLATGAEIVVSPCPICILQINENLIREGITDIKAIHLTELLERAYE